MNMNEGVDEVERMVSKVVVRDGGFRLFRIPLNVVCNVKKCAFFSVHSLAVSSYIQALFLHLLQNHLKREQLRWWIAIWSIIVHSLLDI
jgi:hypothetical protein